MMDNEWDSDGEGVVEDGHLNKYEAAVVLIAVDTHPNMFIDNEFKNCMRALKRIVEYLIVHVQDKRLAVLLAHNDSNIAKLVDFKTTMQETVLAIDKLLQMNNNTLIKNYMCGNVDLASFFLLCKKELLESDFRSRNKIMLFLTNNDDPFKNNVNEKGRLLIETATFAPSNIRLAVTALSENFDYQQFYAELLQLAKSFLIADCCLDPDGIFDKLLNYIQPEVYRQKFKLYMCSKNKDYYINVHIQHFARTVKLNSNYALTKDRNVEVKKKYLSSEVSPKHVININGENLQVSGEEVVKMRHNALPRGFFLLCISDDITQTGWIVDEPTVMFADPYDKSSEAIFQMVWQYCIKNSKTLQCIKKFNCRSPPKIVQLMPKLLSGKQAFLVKYIPTLENVEYLPKRQTERVEKDNTEANANKETVNAFINALLCEYDPRMFPDPVVAKQQEYIRSQVLGTSYKEPANLIVVEDVNNELRNAAVSFCNMLSSCAAPQMKRKRTGQEGRKKKTNE